MKKSTLKQMRRAITVFTYAGMMVVSVIFTNGCKKDLRTDQAQQPIVDDASEAVIAHILEFKERMAYYHENPNLKTGGQLYSASEAVIELESLLNFNFCYTDIQCNQKKFVTSEVIMPLDELEKINDPKLMEVYYDCTIDTIQAQMGRVNYPNMKLLLVDLEVSGMDSNGDAIVSVGALIGNAGTISQTDEIGWWFGGLEGNCQHDIHTHGLDATSIITSDLYFANFPVPAPGISIKKTNITPLATIVPWNNYIDPIAERDNYLDSKVFSADVAYGVIDDDTRCLSDNMEMPFYLDHYNQFIHDADLANTELEFTEIVISYFETFLNNEHERIWHELDIWLGHVVYVNSYEWPVEDITTYQQ